MLDKVEELVEMLCFTLPSTFTEMYATYLVYKECMLKATIYDIFRDLGLSEKKIMGYRNKKFSIREIEQSHNYLCLYKTELRAILSLYPVKESSANYII